MNLQNPFPALFLFLAATPVFPAKPVDWGRAIDLTENYDIVPNLSGDLQGEVAFLQSTLVGPNRAEKKRPLLVTDRAAYMLFYPAGAVSDSYKVAFQGKDGKTLVLDLSPPWAGLRNDSHNKDGRPPVVYSKRAWSVFVPWEFMRPGLAVTIRDAAGKDGKLAPEAFEFGAPIELVTQNIQLGMLLPPEDVQVNKWCWPDKNISPELAINYFQTVPVAKFTVAQYLPIHFPKVVLPNGTVYTEHSTHPNPGIYSGDMRQSIAKCMVSTGINLANVGIPSSIGGTEKQPRPYRQTTVHTTAGMYHFKDKKSGKMVTRQVRHGLSGGGGQLTLSSTTGNEYSHEYGHDHGLGHYPGGPVFSSHARNGAWGFHIFKRRLIANIDWNGKKPESGFPYVFGKDAMAGGKPMGATTEFTLHTPFSLRAIQDKITSQSGVLDPQSPTGYRKWNAENQAMEVFKPDTPKPDLFGVPVMTLVGFYDPVQNDKSMTSFIYPALYGNWGNAFSPEALLAHYPDLKETTCWLQVTAEGGRKFRFPLHAERLKKETMNQFHINLPSSFRYTHAAILYKDAQGERELDARELAAPHGELPEPVIVGREHGFTAAALRLRDMDSFLVPNGYPDESVLERAMEDYYGPIGAYTPGATPEPGRTYRYKGFYAQALPSSNGQPKWRNLGEAKDYLSSKRLALGEASIDYAKEVMKGKSGVYYYVPVDHKTVLASDSYAPAARKWYAGGNHSKLTVVAKSKDGQGTQVVLRGQINGRHVLSRGAPVNESSRVKFTFHKEDNPDLEPGQYSLSFSAYAQGWHSGKLIEAFLVEGDVTVQ